MEMLTAGDEKSSPTGTVLSPSSGPNGKKVIGTAGSRMLSTRTAKSSRTTTENSDRDVDVISAQQVRAAYTCAESVHHGSQLFGRMAYSTVLLLLRIVNSRCYGKRAHSGIFMTTPQAPVSVIISTRVQNRWVLIVAVSYSRPRDS